MMPRRTHSPIRRWLLIALAVLLCLGWGAFTGYAAYVRDHGATVEVTHQTGVVTPSDSCVAVTLPVVVNLDDVKHAHLIAHERDAIEHGQPRQLTLERDNAAERRREDLRGIPTRPGFDRDEWPPAFTEEAGIHTDGRPRDDVAYVPSSENRSGGSVMGAALRPFCDGTRFIVEAGRP